MRRTSVLALIALVLTIAAASASASVPAVFKVPFPFQSGNQKFPAGEYRVALTAEGPVAFRYVASGKEVQVPVLETIAQPAPPVEEPRLVFDAVGNFEPSYTEYFTVYVLAQVWLAGGDGLLIHTTKGAHQTRTVTGTAADK